VANANCYATGPGVGTASAPKTVPAGTQSTFSIFARDVYKNVAADDNLNFQVKLTLLGKTLAYLNSDTITFVDDHYEVDYTPVKAGTYAVSLIGLVWVLGSLLYLAPSMQGLCRMKLKVFYLNILSFLSYYSEQAFSLWNWLTADCRKVQTVTGGRLFETLCSNNIFFLPNGSKNDKKTR
jgi:hypothetical protein